MSSDKTEGKWYYYLYIFLLCEVEKNKMHSKGPARRLLYGIHDHLLSYEAFLKHSD